MKLACQRALVPCLLLAFNPPVAGQSQEWIRQFGTSSSEGAAGAAPDGVGGVYLTGGTSGDLGGPNAGDSDAWIARFDDAGRQLWVRQFGTSAGDGCGFAAVDGTGGIFVGGSTSGALVGPGSGVSSAWIARYDAQGERIWARQFGSSFTSCSGAAMDGTGGAFFGGTTYGSLAAPNAGGPDAWIARHDASGNQLWIRQFGTGGWDSCSEVISDGEGGVLACGPTRSSLFGPSAGLRDAWVARYDAAGNLLWGRQFGSNEGEECWGAASDGAGGIYVTGVTEGSLGGPNSSFDVWDVWLARYDGDGNQLWLRQFGSDDYDECHAATPDGVGGVYLAGRTPGMIAGPGQAPGWPETWIARFDAAGAQLWIRQFGSSDLDASSAMARDDRGGVYLAGSTRGDLGGPNAGSEDAWLARFDAKFDATRYCTAPVPNSTGEWSQMTVTGSNRVADNDLSLCASQLPLGSVGFFLTSQERGFTANPGGSAGNLCLDANIGRYVGPGQIQSSRNEATFKLAVDLGQTPAPTGLVAVQPGETWNFQAWHRDSVGGVATSNFTDAVSVTFR
ncbi:MAG: hypothetical protein AAF726_10170 [Planctomycetota bacterium]